MRKLFEFVYTELSSGRPVASAVIVSSSGSTPRSTGSRLALSVDGRSVGTVGGGPGEALAMREAQKALQSGKSRLLKIDLSGKDAADSGMICGGRQKILVEYLQPAQDSINIFKQLLEDLGAGKAVMLSTAFKTDSEQLVNITSRTLDPHKLSALLSESLKEEVLDRKDKTRLPFALSEQEYTVLVEPISSSGTVLIAGAGHVGEATARLASFSAFRTLVLDDRADFLSAQRFPEVDQLLQVEDFAGCFQGLEVGPESFIVILTRGHVHDKTVLAQALETPARYIGMIGSRKKRDTIYKALLEDGFSQKDLERVHCPIGLSIGADTPEEIAVSIVAELIQERAGAF